MYFSPTEMLYWSISFKYEINWHISNMFLIFCIKVLHSNLQPQHRCHYHYVCVCVCFRLSPVIHSGCPLQRRSIYTLEKKRTRPIRLWNTWTPYEDAKASTWRRRSWNTQKNNELSARTNKTNDPHSWHTSRTILPKTFCKLCIKFSATIQEWFCTIV